MLTETNTTEKEMLGICGRFCWSLQDCSGLFAPGRKIDVWSKNAIKIKIKHMFLLLNPNLYIAHNILFYTLEIGNYQNNPLLASIWLTLITRIHKAWEELLCLHAHWLCSGWRARLSSHTAEDRHVANSMVLSMFSSTWEALETSFCLVRAREGKREFLESLRFLCLPLSLSHGKSDRV